MVFPLHIAIYCHKIAVFRKILPRCQAIVALNSPRKLGLTGHEFDPTWLMIQLGTSTNDSFVLGHILGMGV